MTIRLNKYLASKGIASRRRVDQLISEKRIYLNHHPATLGDKIDPDVDTVTVDKKIIPPHPQQLVYYLLNKPDYVLSTSRDEHGRDTVMKFVPASPRVFPVGRLDYHSTGLILLTNDGDLTQTITHPRFHLPKTYLVSILGAVSAQQIDQLRRGVRLEDGLTAPCRINQLPPRLGSTVLEITLYQGKNRQIRRMCLALGLEVTALHRIAIGPITLGSLRYGQYRSLDTIEITRLKKGV